jgi:hypothetical protein
MVTTKTTSAAALETPVAPRSASVAVIGAGDFIGAAPLPHSGRVASRTMSM